MLPVTGFDLSGHERKPLRSALRRLEPNGDRVVEVPHPIEPHLDDGIAASRVGCMAVVGRAS